MLEQIEHKLKLSFPGAKIDLADTSAAHQGHGATGSHLAVLIVWKGFENKSLVEQHQMVYNSLKEELKEQIHALKIKTKVK